MPLERSPRVPVVPADKLEGAEDAIQVESARSAAPPAACRTRHRPAVLFDDYFAILGTRGSAKVALGFITFVSSVPGVAAEFSTPGAVHGIRLGCQQLEVQVKGLQQDQRTLP
ncbi:hypothetical protein CHLNCDRAFT_143767 [Chlorella variabilis]|uniref:Uncharacterized protein n=1 Tax=Chlorella variabilis TaxID=554065 RepID=E1ZAE4_CHLVA|nr:hypothetical protein CHLNCDRAFT_143767 [Chlorella variabilis]EFN57047.1 hypothetical protein CHLNCDRAFT_143767 [Chlorella variabilis]|eukprot:XP_005849149.1 hypothetical protein CHLNCDRAFT_143767 [Chlorella variabilis]